MQLPEVLRRFNISVQQLDDVLHRHGFSANLRLTKVVPAEWVALLTAEFPDRPLPAPPVTPEVVPAERASGDLPVPARLLFPEADSTLELSAVPVPAVPEPKPRPPARPSARKPTPEYPPAPELRLGQITTFNEERGFGFLRDETTAAELFWHFRAFGAHSHAPAPDTWVFYTVGPSKRKENTEEVRWGRALAHDLKLLRYALPHLGPSTLHRLLRVAPETARPTVVLELLARHKPLDSAESIAAAVATLTAAAKLAPELVLETLDKQLPLLPSRAAAELWLRFRSPVAKAPAVAEQLVQLLLPVDTPVSWWPLAPDATIPDLLLAGLLTSSPDVNDQQAFLQSIRQITGERGKAVYDTVLRRYLENAALSAPADTYRYYHSLAATAHDPQAVKLVASTLYEQIPAEQKLADWLYEPAAWPFPRQAALTFFADAGRLSPYGASGVNEQNQIAAQLTDEELATVAHLITPYHVASYCSPEIGARLRARFEADLLAAFSAVALDLESDGHAIRELTWGTPAHWHGGTTPEAVEQGLTELREQLTPSASSLLVGHNIRVFDAPILAAQHVPIPADILWDTLQVEMALRPEGRVFALRTSHRAEADAALTLRLFLTQVLRLLYLSSTDFANLTELFSPAITTTLTELRARPRPSWLPIPVHSPTDWADDLHGELYNKLLDALFQELSDHDYKGTSQEELEASQEESEFLYKSFHNAIEGDFFTDLCLEAAECLRPQPQAAPWLATLHDHLAATPASVQVVVVPRELRHELRTLPNGRFAFSTTSHAETADRSYADFAPLLAPALLAQLPADAPERALARRFFSHCQQTGRPAIAVNLAPALRIRLEELTDFSLCRPAPAPPEWQAPGPIVLTTDELLRFHDALTARRPDVAVFVVAPDLIAFGRHRLLATLATADLLRQDSIRPLWLQFSGGQSFVSLTHTAQVRALGADVPAGFEFFWLEKHLYGKYRLWGSYRWEPLLAGYTPEQITPLPTVPPDFPPEQAIALCFDQAKLQQRLGVTPFNPETIYRSRYWLLQQELIGQVSNEPNAHPVVLLVQRPDEVPALERYFRRLGYYLPAPAAGLGRRLELLHEAGSSQRLLIAPLDQATAILNANYVGPLHVVLDSFNLLENYYLAQGSELLSSAAGVSAAAEQELAGDDRAANATDDLGATPEADLTETDVRPAPAPRVSPLPHDLFFLLALQRPRLAQLRAQVLAADPAHRLWLLDPRLHDFPNLPATWQLRVTRRDASWQTLDDYRAAAEIADQELSSPRPDHDLPLDLAEAKLALQQVFLPEGADWTELQDRYLDLILPALTDLLVSLPTGGGKSLLFQAPALYRSSFTNRLSIVVTPLKALMEDQVEGLRKLGFYSSVEFINQDRKAELPQIYRRLAGGEVSLLFITPERFRSASFMRAFDQRFDNDQGLEYAVYDEAHCISQWGQEFRPDYLHSAHVVQRYRAGCPRRFPVLLLSATVTEKIYDEFTRIFP